MYGNGVGIGMMVIIIKIVVVLGIPRERKVALTVLFAGALGAITLRTFGQLIAATAALIIGSATLVSVLRGQSSGYGDFVRERLCEGETL